MAAPTSGSRSTARNGIINGSGGRVPGSWRNRIHRNNERPWHRSCRDGVTANDAGDIDAGGNNLQNFPVLVGRHELGWPHDTVTADVSSFASGSYHARVLCQRQLRRLGTRRRRAFSVGVFRGIVAPAGPQTFVLSRRSRPAASSRRLPPTPATARRSSRRACRSIRGRIVLVSNTNDSGPGSLRQAILAANAAPGTQTINFNIPGAGAGLAGGDRPCVRASRRSRSRSSLTAGRSPGYITRPRRDQRHRPSHLGRTRRA